jgi:hypothetical protein
MKNQNAIFAVMMIALMTMMYLHTSFSNPKPRVRAIFWNIPLSKGCVWPVREVKYTKTEIKHIVPVAQVYKCTYDKNHRLVKVSTFNFERGYQMEIPTEEVLYEWIGVRLTRYSVRKASHGNGEIDVEIYTLHR